MQSVIIKELGLGLGFACNTEMLESLGIDYSNIMTEADMEPILQAVKRKISGCIPSCFRQWFYG